MAEKHEYTFDVKLFATITVTAADEKSARAKVDDVIDHSMLVSGGALGRPGQTVDVSSDGEHDLMEVDGEIPD